ncbi:MAG: hypothetical protein KBT01_03035 [Clostridiales bacterium]|nr:hypothetical protein [Candidatus Blautia equi]
MYKKLMKMALASAAAVLVLGTAVCAEEEKPEIITKIEEANILDDLLLKYDNVLIDYTYTDGEEEWTEQIFVTPDSFSHVAPTWGINWVDGELTGYDEGEPDYLVLVMEGAEEEAFLTYMNVPYFVYENDEIISQTEKDGQIELVIQVEHELEDETTEIQKNVLIVDAETYEIKEMTGSVVLEEEEQQFVTFKTTYNAENYKIDEEAAKRAYTGDEDNLRKVTIIADPGTDKEMSFGATVVKEALVLPILAENYENLYTDPECTVLYEAPEEVPDELVLYTKAEE